jgi:hypothetical protein
LAHFDVGNFPSRQTVSPLLELAFGWLVGVGVLLQIDVYTNKSDALNSACFTCGVILGECHTGY